jgi:hypothetical protein
MPAIFDSQGTSYAVWASQAEATQPETIVAGTLTGAQSFGAVQLSPIPPPLTPTTIQPILLTISLTGHLLILAPATPPAGAPPTLAALTPAGALVIVG